MANPFGIFAKEPGNDVTVSSVVHTVQEPLEDLLRSSEKIDEVLRKGVSQATAALKTATEEVRAAIHESPTLSSRQGEISPEQDSGPSLGKR